LAAFQAALKDSDWEAALAFCSEDARTAAKGYPSLDAFFHSTVPVEQIVGLRKFAAHAVRCEGTRRLEAMAYRWHVPVTVDPDGYPVSQLYEIVRRAGRWEISLPCEPLDLWLEQVTKRRREVEQNLGELGKAMVQKAAMDRGEPAPSDEFLAEKYREGRERLEKSNEQRRREQALRRERLAELTPKLAGVRVLLKAAGESFRAHERIPLRLELINGGESPLYYRFAMNAGSLTVLDGQDRIVSCTGLVPVLDSEPARIEFDQTVILLDDYDLARVCAIDRPGRYRVEFNGSGLAVGDRFGDDPNADPTYAEVEFISDAVEINVDR
jgi:hypothetical protein